VVKFDTALDLAWNNITGVTQPSRFRCATPGQVGPS
jgi:hypothetical protein